MWVSENVKKCLLAQMDIKADTVIKRAPFADDDNYEYADDNIVEYGSHFFHQRKGCIFGPNAERK